MNINFSKEDLEFKDEVKEWLANEYPTHVKEKTDKGIRISKEDLIDFHKALSKKGWMGYNWPVEYGGTGWSASKLYIFNKELGLAGCPQYFHLVLVWSVQLFILLVMTNKRKDSYQTY